MSKLRVLFLGDKNVGKTSIIRTLLTHTFPAEVPGVSPQAIIRASPTHSELLLIDTPSSLPVDRLSAEIQQSSIIVLVYDMTRPDTQNKVLSFWLPLLQSKAVIIVGNKKDLPQLSAKTEDFSQTVLAEYPECYICVETSATTYLSLSFLLELVEQRIRFPVVPLINPLTKQPTQAFVRALKIVFRECDLDCDNLLNDDELSRFNFAVFKEILPPHTLEKLKEKAGMEQNVNFEGFLKIHMDLICELKLESVWTVFRHFKFDQQLKKDVKVNLGLKKGQSIEISESAVKYLVNLFQQESNELELNPHGLREIFSTMESPPWEDQDWDSVFENVQSEDKVIGLYSWLSIWVWLLAKYPEKALESLVILGYSLPISTAYSVVKKESPYKKVYHVALLGAPNVGKSELLRSFLFKKARVGKDVCGVIEEAEYLWDTKFLVISTQFDSRYDFDLVCLMYNGSLQSMHYIKEEALPVLDKNSSKLLIFNKTGVADSDNLYSFSLEIGLKEHISINLSKHRPDSLFRLMKDLAAHPAKRPSSDRVFVRNSYFKPGIVLGMILTSVGFCLFFIRKRVYMKI